MAGGIIFVIAMVLVVPVGVMFAGAAWSAVIGWASEAPEDASDDAVATSES